MTCHFNAKAKCINGRCCDICPVPNSKGFYAVTQGAKLVWEQRFILEKRREKRLQTIECEIENLNEERKAVLELPGK